MRSIKLFYLFLFFSPILSAQNIAINNTGAPPDSSAILDLQSASKGLLIPRMDSTARMAIANPANGLLVFDTDHTKFYCHASGEWVEVMSDYTSVLVDKDTDTKIEVEKNPDDDIIQFEVGGVEAWRMVKDRIEPLDPHGSIFIGKGSGNDPTVYQFANVAIGDSALSMNDGHYNVAIGYESLMANTNGGSNIAVGAGTMNNNLSGDHNVGVGSNALRLNQSGGYNVAIGSSALYRNITGFSNVGIGRSALGSSNHNGDYNVALGAFALNKNADGNRNVAIGNLALRNSYRTDQQVAIGDSALILNGSDFFPDHQYYNTAIGAGSLAQSDTGAYNTALGYHAGRNVLGSGNVFLGFRAGENAIGNDLLYISNSATNSPLVFGDFNNQYLGVNGSLGIGINYAHRPLHIREYGSIGQAQPLVLLEAVDSNRPLIQFSEGGSSSTSGMSIEYDGTGSGPTNKLYINAMGGAPTTTFMSGGDVGIGTTLPEAKLNVVNGTDVSLSSGGYIQNGVNSGLNLAIDNNEIMARNNGAASTLALNNQGGNIILGSGSAGRVGIGLISPGVKFHVGTGEVRFPSFHFDGPRLNIINSGASVFIGDLAGENDNLSNNNNVYVGRYAGQQNVSGDWNTAIGHQALRNGTTGNRNIAIGAVALRDNNGFRNVAFGVDAGQANTGNQNVFLGFEAGRTNTGSNNVFVGHNAGENASGSDKLYIDNSNTNSPLIYGEFNNNLLQVNGELRIPTGGSGNTHFNYSVDNRNYIRGETLFDAGDVGIGTTTPDYLLDVEGSESSNYIAQIRNNSTDDNGHGLRIKLGSESYLPTHFIGFYDQSSGIEGYISGVSGNAVSYNTVSDLRLKKNIQPMTDGLDRLRQMNPMTYQWKSDGSDDIGFIAQELNEVVPTAVAGLPDGDVNVSPMAVDYGKVTPVLTAAIKELLAKVEALEKEVEMLKKQK